MGAPDLVVEVLSPSGTTYDRVRKLELYRKYSVGEYWIVDSAAENVEVYRLAGNAYTLTGTLAGEQRLQTPHFPEWELQVQNLFSE